MRTSRHCLLAFAGVSLIGCWASEARKTALVPPNTFDAATATRRSAIKATPATTEAAARVDLLGRKLIAANRQIGIEPAFRTIGSPQPEIFHSGTTEVVITEGLVRQCADDIQLAAILSLELGRMVNEREALAGPQTRSPRREAPIGVPIGNDNPFGGGFPDQTRQAELELARFGKDRPRGSTPVLPPDPHVLARTYLTKAGFPESGLESVAGLVRDAGKNNAFEKQWKPASAGLAGGR